MRDVRPPDPAADGPAAALASQVDAPTWADAPAGPEAPGGTVAPPARADAPRARPSGSRQAAASQRARAVRPKAGRRKTTRRTALVVGGVGCVAAAGVVAVQVMSGGGPAHAISTPQRLGSYVEEPSLASGMGANALRNSILAAGDGEASHVVDAVYEDSTGTGAKSDPLIILFVGGNLSGSASSFITSLTTAVPSAFMINPGSLQGQAACVPGAHLNECVWADNDTFGVIASPVLSPTELGNELRIMRPMVEHVVK